MGFFNYFKRRENLKQISVSEEPEFVDLQLRITKYWQDEKKNHFCQVKGLWLENTVGFEIAFRPDLQLGIVNGDIDNSRFYKEGIKFYSIGSLSNNFIKALSVLYNTNNRHLKMVDKIDSTTFVLGGEPINFGSDYIRTKIFFDDTGEKGWYAEWYVNIDLKNKILELREKDPEYRENIIHMLTNK